MEERSFRSKVIETLWLFWAFHMVGFQNGILGPTILDLQQLLGNPGMDIMAYIFFLQGLGFIVGILLAWACDHHLDPRLVMGVSLTLAAAVNGAMTAVPEFGYVIAMFLLQGCAKGLIDFVALTICNHLWPEKKGVPFQFITLGGGIGAFIVPFISAPFLGSKEVMHWRPPALFVQSLRNETTLPECPPTPPSPPSPSTTTTLSSVFPCVVYSATQVWVPYVIIGALAVPPALAFFVYYCWWRGEGPNKYDSVEERAPPTYPYYQLLLLFLLFLLHVPVFGICLMYGDLLTNFGVHSVMKIPKAKMALMTSMFWGCFLIGRVVSMVATRFMRQFHLLAVNFGGMMVASLVLLIVGANHEVAFWVGTAMFGLFSAPYLPLVMTWVSETVYLTGKVITACLVASGLGEIILPFIGGRVVSDTSPVSLMWFVFGTSIYLVIVFCLLAGVARQLRGITQRKEEEEATPIAQQPQDNEP